MHINVSRGFVMLKEQMHVWVEKREKLVRYTKSVTKNSLVDLVLYGHSKLSAFHSLKSALSVNQNLIANQEIFVGN